MKIPLKRFFPATVLAVEAVGIAALYLSPELNRAFFLIPLVLATLAFFFRLGDRLLFVLIALAVAAGIGLAFRLTLTTSAMLAIPILSGHGLVWLAREQARYRYWRVGLAFLEMIFASILSPEAHMFFLIFLFVVLVSLALSFGFLERNFAARDPQGLERPLRSSFLVAILALSLLIFLSSLAIFPILPRTKQDDRGGGAMPGFSEEVSFSTASFYWSGDEAKAAMWAFRPEDAQWRDLIPMGLLRGKTLEVFTGSVWRGGAKQSRPPGEEGAARGPRLEFLRDPMPTDYLPVPYGTDSLETIDYQTRFFYATGEWIQPTSRGRRVGYWTRINKNFQRDRIVTESELKIPKKGFSRLEALGRELGRKARSDAERIEAVQNYFRGFQAERIQLTAPAAGTHPIEEFLFERKSGHCELFASAAALLFRSMGMPSRLVVGFRVEPEAGAKVLTVRNGDAHAWLEVWTKDRGWTVVDPTPAIPSPDSSWQLVRDLYDEVSGYWHRYILGYEFDLSNWRRLIGPLAIFSGILTLFYFAYFLRRLAGRLRLRGAAEPRREISRALLHLEKRLGRKGKALESRLLQDTAGREWWANYLEFRFGPAIPDGERVSAWRRQGEEITLAPAIKTEGRRRPPSVFHS